MNDGFVCLGNSYDACENTLAYPDQMIHAYLVSVLSNRILSYSESHHACPCIALTVEISIITGEVFH